MPVRRKRGGPPALRSWRGSTGKWELGKPDSHVFCDQRVLLGPGSFAARHVYLRLPVVTQLVGHSTDRRFHAALSGTHSASIAVEKQAVNGDDGERPTTPAFYVAPSPHSGCTLVQAGSISRSRGKSMTPGWELGLFQRRLLVVLGRGRAKHTGHRTFGSHNPGLRLHK